MSAWRSITCEKSTGMYQSLFRLCRRRESYEAICAKPITVWCPVVVVVPTFTTSTLANPLLIKNCVRLSNHLREVNGNVSEFIHMERGLKQNGITPSPCKSISNLSSRRSITCEKTTGMYQSLFRLVRVLHLVWWTRGQQLIGRHIQKLTHLQECWPS